VIGVAAVGRSGQPAYFSSDNLSVEVAAPGVNVPAAGRQDRYWVVSGTSPACALTAGVAALIKSRYPGLTAPQVRRSIIWSASNRPPGGYNDEIGFGTVDAYAALRYAARLASQATHPHPQAARAKVLAGGFFGGGRAGVPPVPVPPRSRDPLIELSALAAICLLLTIAAIWRLTAGLQTGRPHDDPAAAAGRPWPPPGYYQGGYGYTAAPVGYTAFPGCYDPQAAAEPWLPEPPQPEPRQPEPGQFYPGQPSGYGYPHPGYSPDRRWPEDQGKDGSAGDAL
jgi:Subtilase family